MLVPGNLASDGPAARGETGLGGGAGRGPLQQELWGSHPFQVTPGKAGAGTDLCQGCPHLIRSRGTSHPGSLWQEELMGGESGSAAACSSLLLLYSFTQRLCWCLGWAFSPLILSNMLELNSGIHPETPEQCRDAQHKPFPPATPELSFLGALSEANAPHPQELHSPKPGSAEPSASQRPDPLITDPDGSCSQDCQFGEGESK